MLRFTVTKVEPNGVNASAAMWAYFSLMYRGIKELMGSRVEWRVTRMGAGNLPDPLFDHPAFVAREKEIRGGSFGDAHHLRRTRCRSSSRWHWLRNMLPVTPRPSLTKHSSCGVSSPNPSACPCLTT